LKRVHGRYVVLVGGIHENPRGHPDPRRVELLDGQAVLTGFVKNAVDEVVLVDDHYRDVSIPGVRERDRRSLRDVEARRAVQPVPVHPDHRLLVDRSQTPAVLETIHPTGLALQGCEHPIALGTAEVLDGHTHRHQRILRCLGPVRKRQSNEKHHPRRRTSGTLVIAETGSGHPRADDMLLARLPTCHTPAGRRVPRSPRKRGTGVCEVGVPGR